MIDKTMLVLGLPAWFWLLVFPFSMFLLMLAWLTLVFKRQRLATFSVRGLGLSVSIRAGTETTRAADAETERKV